MTDEEWIDRLLSLPDRQAQQQFLHDVPAPDGCLPEELKARADRVLREDVHRSLRIAELTVALGTLTGSPLTRALGLLAEANARCLGGLGEYQRAVELYDEAARIYHLNGRPMEEARSQIGKIYALTFLGKYGEALAAGEWASSVLEAHGQDLLVAKITVNLGLLRGRIGEDEAALALFDRARQHYLALGDEGRPFLPRLDQNRAIVLRNLGQFQASIRTSQEAHAALTALGQTAEAARARQNLALTYYVLGHYNEALRLLDQVRDVFLTDDRGRDVILVDLFISDCLLQLRRFADVLETCDRAHRLFSEMGTRFEVAQSLLNQAAACTGLRRYDQALSSLAEARPIFCEEGNQVWAASTDLETAAVLYHKGEWHASLATALSAAAVFRAHHLPVRQAQAMLIAARSAAAGRPALAHRLVRRALASSQAEDIPSITYQAHHLLGILAHQRGETDRELAEYDRAIHELERLRGQLMVEYRVDFAQDKQQVYEDAISASLQADVPQRALEYAERSKSRAVLDLLAYHLDLGIHARSEADRPVVDELVRLRAERERLYRRWEGREEAREEDWGEADARRQEARAALLGLERQITDLWHRLLVRNADYARDAALWQVRTEPVQRYLDPGVILLHYVAVHGQLVALLVTPERVAARRLPATVDQVQHLVRLFRLNVSAVAASLAAGGAPDQPARLTRNVQGLLGQLHAVLIAPLSAELAPARHIVVVPHGPLHYLPFHALYDGERYMLESWPMSVLPSGSLLCYCRKVQPAVGGGLVIGHSYEGRLPHAVAEARDVARIVGTPPCLEGEATLASLHAAAGECRTLHLATHGEFRADNPLFSGLALADGWLTTMDIFGLPLRASLVTLSACETGRGVLGGGDELLGLMRAFLAAGAASLVLSHWTVDDQSTARLMVGFYQKLAEGWTKGAALRHAQLQLLTGKGDGDRPAAGLAHPYFWAPFFLVGDTGLL